MCMYVCMCVCVCVKGSEGGGECVVTISEQSGLVPSALHLLTPPPPPPPPPPLLSPLSFLFAVHDHSCVSCLEGARGPLLQVSRGLRECTSDNRQHQQHRILCCRCTCLALWLFVRIPPLPPHPTVTSSLFAFVTPLSPHLRVCFSTSNRTVAVFLVVSSNVIFLSFVFLLTNPFLVMREEEQWGMRECVCVCVCVCVCLCVCVCVFLLLPLSACLSVCLCLLLGAVLSFIYLTSDREKGGW